MSKISSDKLYLPELENDGSKFFVLKYRQVRGNVSIAFVRFFLKTSKQEKREAKDQTKGTGLMSRQAGWLMLGGLQLLT